MCNLKSKKLYFIFLLSLFLSSCIGGNAINWESLSSQGGNHWVGVLISNGALSTQSLSVNVSLRRPESTYTQYLLTESGSCSGGVFLPYVESTTFLFSGGTPSTKNLYVRFQDDSGNLSTCYSDSIAYEPLSVSPYSVVAPNLLDYYQTGASAMSCTPSTTVACTHGGERKVVTTSFGSCSGLSMTDELGVFDWFCKVQSGAALFYSVFKINRGLKDLIQGTGAGGFSLKQNRVNLYAYGSWWGSGMYAVWWATPTFFDLRSGGYNNASIGLGGANDNALNLNASGIYVLDDTSSSIVTYGYNINADRVAIVTMGNARLIWNGSIRKNFQSPIGDLGGVGSNNKSAIISLGQQSFSWIEASITGTSTNPPDFGIYVAGSNTTTLSNAYTRIHNSKIRRASVLSTGASIELGQYSRRNVISGSRVMGGAGNGIRLGTGISTNYNILDRVSVSNTLASGVMVDVNADHTTLFGVVSVSNDLHGLNLQTSGTSSGALTVVQSTFGSNGMHGILVNPLARRMTFHNVLLGNNGGSGIRYDATTYNTLLAATNLWSNRASQLGIIEDAGVDYSIYETFSNPGRLFMQGWVMMKPTCNIADAFFGVNNSCQSNVSPDVWGYSVGILPPQYNTSLSGSVLFFDPLVAEGSVTQSLLGNTLHSEATESDDGLSLFEHWAKPSRQAGRCTTAETCIKMDYSLDASDGYVRARSYDGASSQISHISNSSQSCPNDVLSGSVLAAHTAGDAGAPAPVFSVYLRLASELVNDDMGDDDGLCETGEFCLYNPNLGAYQGHGLFTGCQWTSGSTITGDAGTVSGVELFGHPSNGF